MFFSLKLFACTAAIIVLLLTLLVLLVSRIGGGSTKYFLRSHFAIRFGYLLSLILLGVMAIRVVASYMYPKDQKIFKNVDYHLLEHKGFSFDSIMYLVQDNDLGSANDLRQEALWDAKRGTLFITHDSMVAQNFYEPLYCSSKVDGDECLFTLQNSVVNEAVEKNGLMLVLGDDTLTMKIEPYSEGLFDRKKYCHYICTFNHSPADTSTFTKVIHRSYPLTEIVSHCRKLDFSDDFMNLLEGASLLRQQVLARPSGNELSKDNPSDLLFFPGPPLFMGSHVSINGKEISQFTVNHRFSIKISQDFRFFIGNGVRKSDVYKVIPKEGAHVEMLYVLPKMQKLRPESGQLFLTSSTKVAAESKLDGGYFYNLFEEDNNANHINGKIRYYVGSARDSMFFQVQDLYYDSGKKVFAANEDFSLRSRLKMGNNLQWIFCVKDLRSTNPLQWKHFMIFIILFIAFVGVRMGVDRFNIRHYGKEGSLTFLELAVYLVAFTFGLVRLVLAWRMSTFVPFGDINADALAVLRNGLSPWWTTTIFIVSLPLIISTFALLREWLQEYSEKFINRISFKKNNGIIHQFWVPICFVAFLALCFLAGKIFMPIAFNIPIPVIGYFIFGWWLNTLQADEYGYESAPGLPRFVLWLLLVGYLAFRDTGYAAIFGMCYILYFLVICPIVKTNETDWSSRKFRFLQAIKIIGFSVIFILCVSYEGWLIINLLEHFAWVALLGCIALIVVIAVWMWKVRYDATWKRLFRLVCLALILGGTIFSLLNVVGTSHFLTDIAASKGHMKYRAKVQQLKPNEHIDDLLMQNELNSSDVTFIMRSAHNQWFINQYADCFDENGPAFQLKPHFQQGSTYTTQTTDLVVTRYVLAEHGGGVLFWLLASLLLLVIIYSLENPIGQNRSHRLLLFALLLLYITALFVFLSATNRIVFVGQDFPFLSITSKIAVAFPIILFFLAILRTMFDDSTMDLVDSKSIARFKWLIPIVLITLTLICVFGIKPMGMETENSNKKAQAAKVDAKFDVSHLVSDISQRVEEIDKEFVDYQSQYPKKATKGADSLWRNFLSDNVNGGGDGEQQSALQKYYADSTGSNKFFHTLLFDFFTNEQVHKDNPDELVHMRRRNGVYHLCVNKKHYSISSVMNDDIQWKGEILAAKKPLEFGFTDQNSSSTKKTSFMDEDYIVNVLDFSLDSASLQRIPNIEVSWFDTSWTDSGEPLLLVKSDIGKTTKEYFHIENESESIVGSPKKNQIATRIQNNDHLLLNYIKDGNEKNIVSWTYGLDNEDFLARNLWINGRRQLFYPLGKESMWSYNFANLVSDVYGKNPNLRNKSVRISIDYDLHKQFYNIVKEQNQNVASLDAQTVNKLIDFRQLNREKMVLQNNGTHLYFDGQKLASKQRKLNFAVQAVNRQVIKIQKKNPNIKKLDAVLKAIDEIASTKFNYSAVVLDGNGRIRLLFDYDRRRNVDPNNIAFLNRFIRELYMDGNVATEREIFGNKALSLLVPGPGSSFKPIAYTAVTSQQRLDWKSLTLVNVPSAEFCQDLQYYGGVPRKGSGDKKWKLETYGGYYANNYIVQSDNLYHSLVIMFGNQKPGEMERILKKAEGNRQEDFPYFKLGGIDYCFDHSKWCGEGHKLLVDKNSALIQGLGDNFCLGSTNMQGEYDYSYYGKPFEVLRKGNAALRGWSFPEMGSLNRADKHSLRNGFFQMALGANPLEISPLQMAIMGMRLTTLNSAKNITTLSDDATKPATYEFFKLRNGWDESAYIQFQRDIVFKQMRDNFKSGTARQLASQVKAWEKQGYHFYAKTGTLNITEKGNSRYKHLMVIISDEPLENITTKDGLKKVHYYVLYLSYLGIDKEEFNMSNFGPFMEAVIKSETFKNYMSKK